MELSKENRKKLALWIIGIIAVCSLIFLGVQNIGAVAGAVKWVLKLLAPFVTGCGIALVLDVPLQFFERHLFTKAKKPFLLRIKRPLSFGISIFLILVSTG